MKIKYLCSQLQSNLRLRLCYHCCHHEKWTTLASKKKYTFTVLPSHHMLNYRLQCVTKAKYGESQSFHKRIEGRQVTI
uniref:Uncharacterized protein n=1 Tax=Rhizophora mucronata TaxID=61149 RepID=A0A2P2P116_RHIMU